MGVRLHLIRVIDVRHIVPDTSSYDNNAVLDFLRGELLDARLDDAVLCYGRHADLSIGLLKLLTLDWSKRPGADEALYYFSGGACDLRFTVVDLSCDLGVADAQHAPSPFVPTPWLSYWSSDQSRWYFAR